MSEFSVALAEQRDRLVEYLETGLKIMSIHRGLNAKEAPDRYFTPVENRAYEVSALAIALIGSSNSVNVAAVEYRKLKGRMETAVKFSKLLNLDASLLRIVDNAQAEQGMRMTTAEIVKALRDGSLR